MSSEFAIILSDVGGCFKLINENGMLVKNNINEIKNAIINIIQNKYRFSEKSIELFNNS